MDKAEDKIRLNLENPELKEDGFFQKFRQYSKKHKRRIIISTIIVLILLAIVFIFFVFSKLTIFLTDELNIILTPFQQSTTISNKEKANITITIKNDNLLQCNAQCNFTLLDQKTGKSIYNSVEILKHNQKLEKNFQLNVPNHGSGQIIYSFTAVCHNINSIICLTNEIDKTNKAVAAINYELTSDEAHAKATIKPKIEELIYLTNYTQALLEKIPIKKAPANSEEFIAIINLFDESSTKLTSMKDTLQKIIQLWTAEEYTQATSLISDKESTSLKKIILDLNDTSISFSQLINLRNSNIQKIINLDEQKIDLIELMDFYSTEGNINNNARFDATINSADKLQEIYYLYSKNIALSEIKTRNTLDEETIKLDYNIELFKNITAKAAFLSIYGQNLLLLKNKTNVQTELGCDGLRQIVINITQVNLETQENILNNTYNITLNIEQGNLTRYLESLAYKNTISEIKSSNLTEKNRILANAIPEISPSETTDQNYFRLASLNTSKFEEFIRESCEDAKNNDDLDSQALARFISTKFNTLENFKITLDLNKSYSLDPNKFKASLPDATPICCALANCKPCCTYNCANTNYPVLFIHGHAFNVKNSPDYSLTLFNELQEFLEGQGYINLGKLDVDAPASDPGTWGKSTYPATMKASYYYIQYYKLGDYAVGIENDESIENYAIRLKEIIDTVKERTGKDKVILVAHSMGGLVAREYILLFGDSSISKLVTINTPQKGINGRTLEWCSTFGSENECNDMNENSIFISRLNARKLPTTLKAYSVRSSGCKMNGNVDGDGVVTFDNAYFDGAENYVLKGNCTDSLNSNLHNNALNVKEYPEIGRLMLEILKD